MYFQKSLKNALTIIISFLEKFNVFVHLKGIYFNIASIVVEGKILEPKFLVQILTLPLISCVTLGKLLHLSGPVSLPVKWEC